MMAQLNNHSEGSLVKEIITHVFNSEGRRFQESEVLEKAVRKLLRVQKPGFYCEG